MLAALLTGSASAAQYQVGTANASNDGRVLYREHHWTYERTGSPRRLVLYRCPDGAAFARKLVDAAPGAGTPDIDFTDGRDGYTQRVRRAGNAVELRVREPGSDEVSAQLPARSDAVIDAGFDAYVRTHWDAFAGQRSRMVPFLVPDRGGGLDFRVRHVADALEGTLSVRRMRMTLSAWYGFAVPAIELTYERDTRRLLRFEGMGFVRDRRGGHPRVRIEFPDAPREIGEGSDAIDAAARVPLTGRCPG
ncbi:MAG: hypothetical protein ACREER_00895 [Alphaproteobacteria bacterium]